MTDRTVSMLALGVDDDLMDAALDPTLFSGAGPGGGGGGAAAAADTSAAAEAAAAADFLTVFFFLTGSGYLWLMSGMVVSS
jgi:hypothetical protein